MNTLTEMRKTGVPALVPTALLCLLCASCATRPKEMPGSAPEVPQAPAAENLSAQTAKTGDDNSTLELTINGALMMALKNNPSLKVEALAPAIKRTYESEARAAFDPVLGGGASRLQSDGLQLSETNAVAFELNRDATTLALDTVLPTGTKLSLEASADLAEIPSTGGREFDGTRYGLTISQSILKGFGTGANLAQLRQARIDTRISEYEVRGFAESLAAQVEKTCWDYILAGQEIDIYRRSLALAEQQVTEVGERIKVGKLADIELAAVQAERASRREALIDAENNLKLIRLNLLRLLSPGGSNQWVRDVAVTARTEVAASDLDNVEDHVAVAMKMRPDLNQARLGVERSNIEIVRTKNGLLPRMDFFVTLGRTGYADSFAGSLNSDGGKGKDTTFGVTIEYPLGSRREDAQYERAVLQRDSANEALENLGQLVQVDVRSAHLEVKRALEQMNATKTTRAFQEAKANAETEKLRVGKSTSLQAAQAQRDLVQSQVNEVEALAGYFKALADLYRLDGSLLRRLGIAAPGGTGK